MAAQLRADRRRGRRERVAARPAMGGAPTARAAAVQGEPGDGDWAPVGTLVADARVEEREGGGAGHRGRVGSRARRQAWTVQQRGDCSPARRWDWSATVKVAVLGDKLLGGGGDGDGCGLSSASSGLLTDGEAAGNDGQT